MMPQLPLSESMIATASQTLVHFIWQGLALCVIALGVLHVAGRSPQARYAIHCVLLILLVVVPLATLCIVSRNSESIGEGPSGLRISQADPVAANEVPAELAAGPNVTVRAAHAGNATTDFLWTWLEEHRAWIVSLWFVGSALMAIRLSLAAIGVWSIVRRRRPIPDDVASRVDRLARRMAFVARPAVYAVERISQAMAVGLVRPMVLLPAWWILELPSDVLEAVIAHELAHLRRWDLPINFVQRVIEIVFFFHPVVWWCSRRLRIEREMCCDELAQAAIGNRALYATALSYLAHRQGAVLEPLLAAGVGGPQMVLLQRIRNVLRQVSGRGRFYGSSCALIGAVAASIVWLTVLGATRFQRVSPPDKFDEEAMVAPPLAKNVPSERAKRTFPNYTIEPPDILFIEAIRLVPKPPYRIQPGDELALVVEPEDASLLRSGRGYFVDSEGRLNLGPRLGRLKVAKLTVEEAEALIVKQLENDLREARVSLSVVQTSGLQPITGEHLVAPDGRVNLGTYGHVYVAGMTLEETRAAIEKHLATYLDDPQVSVSVFKYNSKVYYVITEGASGDMVSRLPITGSETVLDAISQVSGLTGLSKKKIWIARPAGNEGRDLILPVNWTEITRGASTSSNYQVLPGDRIFIADRHPTEPKPF